jgi:hypothetical protein
MMKTKIYYSLDSIKQVVEELMPPKNNHLIGKFRLEFYLSSKSWDYSLNLVEITNKRGFSYFIRKATLEQEIEYLRSNLDEYYHYSDDHKHWKSQVELRATIESRLKELADENQIWILQELSKRTFQL